MNQEFSDDRRAILLASMRVARANLALWVNEIDSIGALLKGNVITVDCACTWLDDCGLLSELPLPDQERAA